MQNKTDDELKQIAIDLRAGRIFCDRHIPEGESLSMVFMVLNFLDEAGWNGLKEDPPGMIYEYLDQAGPRSCNGLPGFFSMQMLSRDDSEKLFSMVSKLENAEINALN